MKNSTGMWIFKEPRKPRPVANLLIWEYGSPNKEKHLPTAPCFHLLTFHCLRKESYIISMICRVRNTAGASADSCSVWVTGPLRLQGISSPSLLSDFAFLACAVRWSYRKCHFVLGSPEGELEWHEPLGK